MTATLHLVRDTSLAAYEYMQARGITSRQQQRVVLALYGSRPMTRSELAEHTGIAINGVCGRVKELLDGGHLAELEARPCQLSGFRAHPLTLVSAPEQKELPL